MGTSRKITIILVIVALVGAGVWAMRKWVDKKPAASPNTVINEVKQQEFNDAIKKASALDQDLDGLSDSDEVKYKTSATSSDTDDDGLTDSQEVSIYRTDPLKSDTDGDGFADGYEIRRNLNPSVAEKVVK